MQGWIQDFQIEGVANCICTHPKSRARSWKPLRPGSRVRLKPRLHIAGLDGDSWRFGIPPGSARKRVSTVFNPQVIRHSSAVIREDRGEPPEKIIMFNFSWWKWRFEMDRVHSRSQRRSPCKERQHP